MGDSVDDAIRKYGGSVSVQSSDIDDAVRKYGGSVGGQADVQQPQGSAAGRLFSNLGAQFNPLAAVKMLGMIATHGANSPEAHQFMEGIIQSSKDQVQKAQDAWAKGEHVEAAGHLLGALPLIGPAAAAAGEQMGGTDAVYDKYGNVVTPAKAPDIAGGIGSTLGLVGGAVLPVAVAKIPGVKVLPKLVNPNAVKAAAADWAMREGIPIPADVASGNSFLQLARQAGESTVGGSVVGGIAKHQLGEALAAKGGELAEAAYPGAAVNPESAGAAARGGVERTIAKLRGQADDAYEEFRSAAEDPANARTVQTGTKTIESPIRDATGNPTTQTVPVTENIAMPVDVRAIKARLAPIAEEMKTWMEPARRNASAGYQAIQSILQGPDFLPADVAEKGLGGLKAMSREAPSADLRNVNQGLAAGVVGDLQNQIDTAVAQTAGGQALQQLRNGRRINAAKMDAADVLGKLRDEPVQLFNQLTWANDAGIEQLRNVAKLAPEQMPKLGRAYIENLMDTATREGGLQKAGSIFNKWQNVGPETKKILFKDPAQVEALDKFFQVAKMAAEQANPSKTALSLHSLGQGAVLIQNPALGTAYALGQAGLVKLLYSPAGVRALTQGLTVPLGNRAASAMAAGQILRLAGNDAVRLPQGAPATAAQSTGQSQQSAPLATVLPQ